MPETDLVTFAQDPLSPFLPNNSQKQEHMPQLHDYGVTLLRTPYSISETEVLLNVQGADARGKARRARRTNYCRRNDPETSA
jgi:hypothetical protein